jgi:hypothetical protein
MSEGNVPFPTRGLIADSRPRARLMESGVSAHDSVAGVIAIFQEQSRGVISELPRQPIRHSRTHCKALACEYNGMLNGPHLWHEARTV